MNTRKLPAIIMLLAGSVACVLMYLYHYSLKDMLIVLVLVLVVFLFVGIAVKAIVDAVHLPNSNAVSPDGEVIEKKEEEITDQESAEGEEVPESEDEEPDEAQET